MNKINQNKPQNEGYISQIISEIRETLFPIKSSEILYFILVSLILAAALFAFTTSRIVKDSLLSTAPGSSSEVFSFLKTIVIPTSMFFVYINHVITSNYSFKTSIICVYGFFGLTLMLFGIIIPLAPDYLHPSAEYLSALQAQYPRFRFPLAIFGNWVYALAYIVIDVSGNFLVTYAFWKIANQLTNPDDARRIYPFYSMYGNMTGILLASQLGSLLRCFSNNISFLDEVRFRLLLAGISLILAMISYLAIDSLLITNETTNKTDNTQGHAAKQTALNEDKAEKLTFYQNAKLLFSSLYLRPLGLCVLAYGLCVNLVESVWKRCIKDAFPDGASSMSYYDDLYFAMAITSFITGIIGGKISKYLSWFWLAVSTPLIMLITGFSFYIILILSSEKLVGYSIAHYSSTLIGGIFGCTTSGLLLFTGKIQNLLGKSTKYIMFDSSMQRFFALLSKSEKTSGKSLIDIVLGRFGKSGSATITSLLLPLTGGDIYTLVPILSVIFAISILIWISSVLALSPQYQDFLAKSKK